MAYSVDNIAALSVSNNNTGGFFTYKEAETLANMRASGYFDSAVDAGLATGDVVILLGSDGFGMSSILVTGTVYSVVESITSA